MRLLVRNSWVIFAPCSDVWLDEWLAEQDHDTDMTDGKPDWVAIPGNQGYSALVYYYEGSIGGEERIGQELSRWFSAPLYAVGIPTEAEYDDWFSCLVFESGKLIARRYDVVDLLAFASSLGVSLPTRPPREKFTTHIVLCLCKDLSRIVNGCAQAGYSSDWVDFHETKDGYFVHSKVVELTLLPRRLSRALPEIHTYDIMFFPRTGKFCTQIHLNGKCTADFEIPDEKRFHMPGLPENPKVDNIHGETDPRKIVEAFGVPLHFLGMEQNDASSS